MSEVRAKLTKPNETLLRISQDMTRVLEILITSKASIDMVRRHGAEEFHGTNMEESDNRKVKKNIGGS